MAIVLVSTVHLIAGFRIMQNPLSSFAFSYLNKKTNCYFLTTDIKTCKIWSCVLLFMNNPVCSLCFPVFDICLARLDQTDPCSWSTFSRRRRRRRKCKIYSLFTLCLLHNMSPESRNKIMF